MVLPIQAISSHDIFQGKKKQILNDWLFCLPDENHRGKTPKIWIEGRPRAISGDHIWGAPLNCTNQPTNQNTLATVEQPSKMHFGSKLCTENATIFC